MSGAKQLRGRNPRVANNYFERMFNLTISGKSNVQTTIFYTHKI